MSADFVSGPIVTNLLDLRTGQFFSEYGTMPEEGTPVMAVWEGKGIVITVEGGLLVGYLMAQYNELVRRTTLRGSVVRSSCGADPLVTVRLAPA
jgi:hypothetical protein